ncbi:MAG: CPBP family intramembrane metalloprotease [Tannerella sp.]|jgi:membrane protease YdiL (CAAX protease family)|nr:CPBP family intramembrane metalloprotease [Tannerella sp.]
MNLKGILAGKPVLLQLVFLLFFVLFGSMLTGLLASLLSFLPGWKLTGMNALRWEQLLSEGLMFFLPTLMLAYLCSTNVKDYLSLRACKRPQVWIAVFASILLSSAPITLLSYFNEQLKLPAFLSGVEHWMREMEDAANNLASSFFSDGGGLKSYLFNLVVMAASAGVAEEFFFRGAVQRLLGKKIRHPQAVIWIAAAIFSAFHLQFYGFFPRLLLGAYFGYLLLWSRSIWLPVFAHFVNNAIAVTGSSFAKFKDTPLVTGDFTLSEVRPYILLALASAALFFFCLLYLRRQCSDFR